jgi:serine/threonine protein kinase
VPLAPTRIGVARADPAVVGAAGRSGESASGSGPFEILAPIGAGGMGEVYRAKDSSLGRQVANKVLPAHLAASASAREWAAA